MISECPECGCKLGPFGTDIKVGYTATRDLSQLSLSKEELAILKEMQDTYKHFKLFQHQNSDHKNNMQMHQIRGMKYAFDAIQTTEDGLHQSIDWQAVLY